MFFLTTAGDIQFGCQQGMQKIHLGHLICEFSSILYQCVTGKYLLVPHDSSLECLLLHPTKRYLYPGVCTIVLLLVGCFSVMKSQLAKDALSRSFI